MPQKLRVWLAALCACAAAAAAAEPIDPLVEISDYASGEPFELTADAFQFETERALYVARGNVVIRQAGRTLRADWAAFNKDTGAGVASGNVELVDGSDVVRAEFVEFNITDLGGVVYDGSIDSPSQAFRASGAEIAKTGERSYAFRDGAFTTCRCPDSDERDPWTIRAEEADFEIEGYGTARNATFDVLGVPVAWIPWMILPIKTERQSGFLLPELSLGSLRGFELGLPFFWAIRDDAGLVLTPRFTTKRGFGGAARFEYVVGEESGGEVSGAYARDWDIDPNSPEEPFGRNRWSLDGVHDLALPGDLHFLTDFRFASDNQVPFDFDDLSASRSDRFLESVASVSRSFGETGRVFGLVGATFTDDLQNPDNVDRDRFLLQRWPTVAVSMLPGPAPWLSALVPSIDLDYSHFGSRERAGSELPSAVRGPRGVFLDTGVDGVPNGLPGVPGSRELGPGGSNGDQHLDDAGAVPDGTEGDGVFQEGEPLTDAGQRLVLHPKLALPLTWRGLQLVPEVGWHETLYDTRVRDFRERGFPTTRVDLSTRLRRRFGALVHWLEPQLGYAFAATGSQGRNPLLVPGTAVPMDRVRALDLDAVTRDPSDRIERAQQLTFGFGNRLFAPSEDSRKRLFADVTLLGLYDIEERALSAVLLDGRVHPFRGATIRFHADLDPDHGRFDEVLGDVSWSHSEGHVVSAGYRYLRRIPRLFESFFAGDRFEDDRPIDRVDQLNAALQLSLTGQWLLRYRVAYSIEQDLVLANRGLLEYLSECGCWAIGLELSEDRSRGVEAKLIYRLVGFGGDATKRRGGLLDGLGGLW